MRIFAFIIVGGALWPFCAGAADPHKEPKPPAMSKVGPRAVDPEIEAIRERLFGDSRRLVELLGELGPDGIPSERCHQAALALAQQKDPRVLPYLVRNLERRPLDGVGVVRSGNVAFALYPYLREIERFGPTGAEAILNHVADCEEAVPTDEQMYVFAAGVLRHCRFNDLGRDFAMHWIDLIENRRKRTGALDRLRERIPLTEGLQGW